MNDSQKSYEEIYLKEIHDTSDEVKVNLHTYLYWKDYEVCPICNEWLVMRCKPEATT